MADEEGVSSARSDPSFLAAPGQVSDWRLILTYAAAADSGILNGFPATANELAERYRLDSRLVRAILEALELWDMVEVTDGIYQLGTSAPGAAESAVMRHHARSLRMWAARLDDRLAGGRVAPPAGPAQPEVFLEALAVHARRRAPGLIDACLARVPEARRVLDLGGGHGEYAMEFARRGCQVVMQDRPAMISVVEQWGRLEQAGVTLFAADFFEALPDEKFDIVLCAGVTHTYDGEHNRLLYRRVASVLGTPGALVISSYLAGKQPAASLFALQMLLADNDGDTHSESQYRQWLADAGFGRVDIVDFETSSEPSMLVARQ